MSSDKKGVKKGFSFLSFFLGIFLGIIILAGALFGAGYFALSANLDKVLGVAGLDNGKDENGRNKYVNTDPGNGGAQNVLELLQKISALTSDIGGVTIGRIDELFPAAGGLAEGICSSFSQYANINYEQIKDVKFADFGTFVSGMVMDIRPAALISGEMNNFMRLLLEGVEADCVVYGDKVRPLYHDVESGAYAFEYDGVWYRAEESGGGFAPTQNVFENYNAETAEATGNYYIDGGEKIFIDPVTIGTLSGTDGMGPLGRVSIAEILGEESGGMVDEILGGITLSQFMNGEADIESKINGLEISSFIDADVNDELMLLIVYGVKNVKGSPEEGYTAVCKLGDGSEIPVNLTVEEGKVTAVTDADGNAVGGTEVGSLSSVADKIDVSVFLDVTVDNKIAAYLAYGITDITSQSSGYTALKDGEPCTLELDGNKIISVTLNSSGEKVPAAGVSELGGRMEGVSSDLKIKDIIDPGDNKILQKLGNYTLSGVSEGVDLLEITDVADIDRDSAVMAYLAYGVSRVNKEDNTAFLNGEKVYLKTTDGGDGKTYIEGVYRESGFTGEPIEGVKINGINGRLEKMTGELTIGELLEGGVDKSNSILYSLRNSTIDGLADDVQQLTVNEIYADKIYGGAELKKVKKNGDGDIDFNPHYLYYVKTADVFGGESYKMVSKDGQEEGKLSEYAADDNEIYYTYGEPTEFWQLLVTVKSGDGEGDEKAYKLNSLTDMTGNISNNMEFFTLRALKSAGIIKFDGVDLNTSIPMGIGSYGGKQLGDLTVPDAIKAMVEIINNFSRLGG